MHTSRRAFARAFTIVEILVAVGILAIASVAMTQAMLVLNRNSAIARVKNLAKALVLSRVQEVAAMNYDPAGVPPNIPAPLVIQNTSTTVNIGDASTSLGLVPGTLKWVVTNVGSTSVRSVRCTLTYNYLGRPQIYDVLTYHAPD